MQACDSPTLRELSRGKVDVIVTPALAHAIATPAHASPPASVISDSVMYCGRFPAMEPGACLHCGELRCPHTDTDEVSLVSSAGQSSATSAAASDQLVCWPGGRSCSEELQSPEQAQPQARDYRGGGTLSRQALHQVGITQ